MTSWDGDAYQRKFDQLAASGENVHGEVDLLMTYGPASALDAGCGTGRVAIELANRGVDVVGVDVEADMLATARERAPHLRWVEADLASLDLGDTFDAVVMAGNVMLFVADRAATVASCARHLRAGGRLVAGFQVVELVTPSGHHRQGCDLASYDQWCAEAGLQLADRFATWDREPYDGGGYAVSVHQRAGAAS